GKRFLPPETCLGVGDRRLSVYFKHFPYDCRQVSRPGREEIRSDFDRILLSLNTLAVGGNNSFRVVLHKLPCVLIVSEEYYGISNPDAIIVWEDESRPRFEFDVERSDLHDARTEISEGKFDRCAGVLQRRQEYLVLGLII